MYVYQYKRYSKKKNVRHLMMSLLLCICFAGFVLGVLMTDKLSERFLSGSDFLFFSFMETRAENSFLSLFLLSFSSSCVCILAFCFLGFSVPGTFVVPILLFSKIFILGVNLARVCVLYAFKGALWNLLVVLPGAYVLYCILLFSAKESMSFSKKVRKCIFQKDSISSVNIKTYSKRMCCCTLLLTVPALLDGLMALFFSGMFI